MRYFTKPSKSLAAKDLPWAYNYLKASQKVSPGPWSSKESLPGFQGTLVPFSDRGHPRRPTIGALQAQNRLFLGSAKKTTKEKRRTNIGLGCACERHDSQALTVCRQRWPTIGACWGPKKNTNSLFLASGKKLQRQKTHI